VAVVACGPASAELWRIEPTANLETGYEDNVRLTSTDAEDAFYSNLDAAFRATRSSEVADLGLVVELGASRYAGVPDLDNNSGFAGLELGYRLERQRLRMSVGFTSQSTLTSEVATTGLVQVNRQQQTLEVDSGWNYLLSERAAVDLAANYQEVSYEDVEFLPLFDYRVGSVELGGNYAVTERLELTGLLTYGRYEAQGLTNDYSNVDLMVGADYLWSETSSLSALVGGRRTEQTFLDLNGSTITRDSSGPTFMLTFSKQFEAGGGLSFEARRALLPSGSGEVLDTTGLFVRLNYRLRPRWLFGLSANAYRNREPGGEGGDSFRTYASVEPGIAYEIDESWQVSATYRARWEDRNELADDVFSNAIYLTLNWSRPWDL
jgi:hypothetical protein